MDTIGAFIGPLIAFVLLVYAHRDYRFIFWCALLPAILAVGALFFGISEPSTKWKAKKNTLSRQELVRLGPTYWTLVAGTVLFNLGNSSDAFLLLRAQQTGVPAVFIPIALVVMNVVYALCAYPFGVLSDRIGRLNMLLIGSLLDALVYAGFAWSTAQWQIWILFPLYGVYLGLTQGALSALVADVVSEDLRGTAYGFISLACGLTLLPASIIAGVLWDHVSPASAFLAGSCFALAGTLLLFIGFAPRYRAMLRQTISEKHQM
jgi:MFS family permease